MYNYIRYRTDNPEVFKGLEYTTEKPGVYSHKSVSIDPVIECRYAKLFAQCHGFGSIAKSRLSK